MRARRRLSDQVPDHRSGTSVTARPEEQLAPNRPILSALALYIAMRSCIEAVRASTFSPPHFLLWPPATHTASCESRGRRQSVLVTTRHDPSWKTTTHLHQESQLRLANAAPCGWRRRA